MNCNENYLHAIYLMSKSLNGQSNATDAFSESSFFSYCVSQGLDGIISYCADSAYKSEIIDKEEHSKWEAQRSMIIFRNLKYEAERERLFKKLTDKQIFHMPMKGIILDTMYPKPGMRAVGDNDIFFDVSKVKEMDQIMLESGFQREEAGNSYHYIYGKKPFYIFEMHIALMKSGMEVSRARSKAIREYYINIRQRMIADEDNPYLLSFTPEDFFIFHLIHAASHFNTSGIGLRFLADTYILLRNSSDTYNWDYINNIVDMFLMKDFKDMMINLSLKLFSENKYDYDEYKEIVIKSLGEKDLAALNYIAANTLVHNHDEALAIQMSMIHQKTDSFYGLSQIEDSFSPVTKLKYLWLYFAQMCDEIEINLISTGKSTIMLPAELLKKSIYKISSHKDTIKHYIAK